MPGLADAIQRTGVLATAEEPAGAHGPPASGRPAARFAARQAEAALVASAIEFLLEGLHLARRLNKDRLGGAVLYRR